MNSIKKKLNILLKRVTSNWHIKLISLLLAFVLWVYVQGLEEKERFVSVPLEVRNVPSGFMISSDIPDYVSVVLKGKESSFTGINWNNLRAYIDISNSTGGRIRGVARVDENSLPQGVSVKEINPRVVEIQVEKVLSKKVEVMPVIAGEPPYGYACTDIVMQPQKVTIEGPESLIESIDSITTEEINMSDLTESTVMEVSLASPGKKIYFPDSEKVKVKIEIVEEFVIRRIDVLDIKAIGLDEKFRVSFKPSTVTVLIKIPKRLEQRQITEKIEAYIELSDIEKPGSYERPILFRSLVEDISLVKLEPLSTKITVEHAES